MQQEFTNDDGSVSTYGLYVFGSYNGYLDYVFVPGNYVKFYGVITEYLGNLQLTDVKYDPNWPGEHDVEVLEENRPYTTKVMTISEIKDTPYTNILVRLENVVFEPEGSYKNDKGMSIRVKDDTNNVITIRAGKGLYFTDENGKEIEDVNYFATKGKMTFTGNITFFKAEEDTGPGANQIDLSSMDDVTYEKK